MSHSFKIYPFKSMVLGSLLLGSLCIPAYASPREVADFHTYPDRTWPQKYDDGRNVALDVLREVDNQLVERQGVERRGNGGNTEAIEDFREQIANLRDAIWDIDEASGGIPRDADLWQERAAVAQRNLNEALRLNYDVMRYLFP